MIKPKEFNEVFLRGVSPFMKWALTPILILCIIVCTFSITEPLDEGGDGGMMICTAVSITCICAILALWGVPFAGRFVSAAIGIFTCWYVIDECFVNFDGNWRFGESGTTPIGSILAFWVFGKPCLIYTILGRFTVKRVAVERYKTDSDDNLKDNNHQIG